MKFDKSMVLSALVAIGSVAVAVGRHVVDANDKKAQEDKIVEKVMERLSSKND
jgi:predicted regulator of amino acid metabolism with ACT domain